MSEQGKEAATTVETEESEEYKVGEEVLVFYGNLLFTATVLDIDMEDDDPFFVHFEGWHKRYDMWVPANHMNKKTEDNLEYQAELEAAEVKKNKKKKAEQEKKRGLKRKATTPKAKKTSDKKAKKPSANKATAPKDEKKTPTKDKKKKTTDKKKSAKKSDKKKSDKKGSNKKSDKKGSKKKTDKKRSKKKTDNKKTAKKSKKGEEEVPEIDNEDDDSDAPLSQLH